MNKKLKYRKHHLPVKFIAGHRGVFTEGEKAAIDSLVAKSVFDGYGIQVFKWVDPFGGTFIEVTRFDKNGGFNCSFRNRINAFPDQYQDLWFDIDRVIRKLEYGNIDNSEVGMVYDPLPKGL